MFQTLEKIFVQITSTNICDLLMSIIIMAVVFIVKELNDKYKSRLPVPVPIEVIMVRGFEPATLELFHTNEFVELEIWTNPRTFFSLPQTVIACGVSYGFNFEKRFNVDIVGKMVRG